MARDHTHRYRIAREGGLWVLQRRGLFRRWRAVGDDPGFTDLNPAEVTMRYERWRRGDDAYMAPVSMLIRGVTVPAGATLHCNPDRGPLLWSGPDAPSALVIAADALTIIDPSGCPVEGAR